ncbi:MAG: hypothetical protein KKH41_03460 [Candidatus Thermoplasmatota archaeon]|nr:DNA replication complex GINS family protein [Euryarchaeota archaeon]MBU4032382.1 hypothetical protein [Candidatus Thermoplasmatota archaeon]MBU4071129.1 hypothetical protein [Candidatus Thermoplasmatota archaeon]MBU4144807.1 hypothetical protein [Candidatus Thermoplasmatota archaeon]MBU4591623.1 hypothetical protein [Candidatus Thermoplasmatota archaeon]
MTGDEIGFGEISDVYRNERRSKVLTKLPPHFHERAEEHIQKLRSEHCDALQTPNSPNAMMLWDQVSKAEKRLKLIYDIRERKITLAALDKMVGAQTPDNMARKEKALYEQLVETLQSFRKGAEVVVVKECPAPTVTEVPIPKPEKIIQSEIPKPVPEISNEEGGVTIVHVLEDIPEFAGMNTDYELKKDDIITIPTRFASILSSRGLVRIVPG